MRIQQALQIISYDAAGELGNSPSSTLYSTAQKNTCLASAGTHRSRLSMAMMAPIVRQRKCIMGH
ncbi:hypothetical protein DPMN_033971 [Dreissena polymorpha]|uniref:Uncharacterized protein n=1 Tax=Dreissena polymorpha TaxID=45954 RepID=A0A9D4RJB1_DREPO|nr:hypothetical protein DPMN_033971 [Dreissena polymorpha]